MEAIQILLVLIYCTVTVVTIVLGVAMANLQLKVDELEKTIRGLKETLGDKPKESIEKAPTDYEEYLKGKGKW